MFHNPGMEWAGGATLGESLNENHIESRSARRRSANQQPVCPARNPGQRTLEPAHTALPAQIYQAQELEESWAERIVDSPNEQTCAHLNALYGKLMRMRQRRHPVQSLTAAANGRRPAYLSDRQWNQPQCSGAGSMNLKKCCSAEEDNAMLQGSNLPWPHLLAALQHHHIAQELTGGLSEVLQVHDSKERADPALAQLLAPLETVLNVPSTPEESIRRLKEALGAGSTPRQYPQTPGAFLPQGPRPGTGPSPVRRTPQECRRPGLAPPHPPPGPPIWPVSP